MGKENERKHARYHELADACQRKGWQSHREPVQVDCQGFSGRSLGKALLLLGITGRIKRDPSWLVGSPGKAHLMLKDLKPLMSPSYDVTTPYL